ncbi:MAG: 5'/3'-nucleotidase SurE [Planctomycetota bacterium]
MKILVTNDDGFYAPGLRALVREFSREHTVWVCAPTLEHSGKSHAITLGPSLECHKTDFPHAKEAWRVDGTPADCVKMALSHLIRDPIDLVLSGINNGLNLGVSVFYSGTISAAVEACLSNVAAVAVSTEHHRRPVYDEIARHLHGVVKRLKPAPGTCHNVNYPDPRRIPWHSVMPARQSIQGFDETYKTETLPGGATSYYLAGSVSPEQEPPDTDVSLQHRGAVTITPIRKDFTDREGLQNLRNLFGNMPPPVC